MSNPSFSFGSTYTNTGATPTVPNYGSSYGSALSQYGAPTPMSFAPTVPVPAGIATPQVPTAGGGVTIPQNLMNKVQTAVNSPQTGWQGVGNMVKNSFLTESGGLNFKNIGSLAETIGAFGQLWSGIQANKIAKETLGLQREAYQTNLEGQRASYNMALEDRITSRTAQTGGSQEDAAAYISKYRLGS